MDFRIGIIWFAKVVKNQGLESEALNVVLPGYVDFFCLLLRLHQLLAKGVQSLQRICNGIEQQDIFF